MAALDDSRDITRRFEEGEISAAEAHALFRDVLLRYLAGEISGPEAEALTGSRFPAERRSKPLGEPDYVFDWEALFEACESDDDRNRLHAIRTAMAANREQTVDREAQITLIRLVRRALESRELRGRARRRRSRPTPD